MRKKYVVEFGKRGGGYTESLVLSTEKAAREVVSTFVRAINGYNGKGSHSADWSMTLGIYRKSWQGAEYFAALSVTDGVMRGPASSKLWKKDDTQQGFKEESYGQITY